MKILIKNTLGDNQKSGAITIETVNRKLVLDSGSEEVFELQRSEKVILSHGRVRSSFFTDSCNDGDSIEISINRIDLEYDRNILGLWFGMGYTIKANSNGKSLIRKKYNLTHREVLVSISIALLGVVGALIYMIWDWFVFSEGVTGGMLNRIIVILVAGFLLNSTIKVIRDKNYRHHAFSITFTSFVLCVLCELFFQNTNPISIFVLVLTGVFVLLLPFSNSLVSR